MYMGEGVQQNIKNIYNKNKDAIFLVMHWKKANQTWLPQPWCVVVCLEMSFLKT